MKIRDAKLLAALLANIIICMKALKKYPDVVIETILLSQTTISVYKVGGIVAI